MEMLYSEFAKSGGVNLDTTPPHNFEGIKFLDRKVVDFAQIEIPDPDSVRGKTNTARQGDLDGKHIAFLRDSFKSGVRLDHLPPALMRLESPIESNGSIKSYELLWGNHRMASFESLDVESWEFDIYENDGDAFLVSSAQLQENTEHAPSKPASHRDITSWHTEWLNKGHWCDDAGNPIDVEISKSLKKFKIPAGSRPGLVTRIINGSDRHASVKNYVDQEHVRWMKKHMTKENPILSGPNQNTFVVKTGTEHRTLMNLLGAAYKTGRVYNVMFNPVVGSVNDVKQARKNLVDSMERYWDLITHFGGGEPLKRPFIYRWFLPQDIENEDMTRPVNFS